MQPTADLERLSSLIDFIYQGATEPALWPRIMADASRWLGSPKGMLYTPLHGAAQGGFYFQHGLSDFFLDLYKARYQAVDMWTEQVIARDLFRQGNVIVGTDMVPHAALRQSAWYRDCLQVGGIAHLLSSVVFAAAPARQPGTGTGTGSGSGTGTGTGTGTGIIDMPTACSFYRGEDDPAYTDDDRRRLALLLPHISRALGVMTRLQLSGLQVAASLSALDRLPSAVLLMAAGGHVLFANQVASAMLADTDALRIEPTADGVGLGRLVSRLASVDRELARALSAAKRIDGAEHFASAIKVPARQEGRDWLIQLSRVRLGDAFRGELALPEVIAFITDARRPLDVDIGLLRRTYGLTAAEARVAVAATAAGATDDLAAALALGANTVKTHLKHVYAKTGANGRADLIRVLLGLASLQ